MSFTDPKTLQLLHKCRMCHDITTFMNIETVSINLNTMKKHEKVQTWTASICSLCHLLNLCCNLVSNTYRHIFRQNVSNINRKEYHNNCDFCMFETVTADKKVQQSAENSLKCNKKKYTTKSSHTIQMSYTFHCDTYERWNKTMSAGLLNLHFSLTRLHVLQQNKKREQKVQCRTVP